VEDCQWIRHLHSVGLLRGSFRPDDEICSIRSLWRHRENLIQLATVHLQHMQKALDQMNLQIHHVISDLSGTTGLAIIDAILPGERDPQTLAKLRDWRIKASEETIMKSLVGDYREEHLFVLRQSLIRYRSYRKMIQELDEEVNRRMVQPAIQVDPAEKPLRKERNPRKTSRRTEPLDLRRELYRAFGVDLTQVPGINPLTAQVLLTEVGPTLSRFPTAAALLLLAAALSGAQNQRRSGVVIKDSPDQKSRRTRLAACRPGTAQKSDFPRGLLPQNEGTPRPGKSHYCGRTQARPYRLSSAHEST
jgi:transposase